MTVEMELAGVGHAVGSAVVRNADTAVGLGLPPDWLERRTGIVERRTAAAGENALTLATAAVTMALEDAGLAADELGSETVLIHIQNELLHVTPPAGAVLCGHMGLHKVRPLGIDGACAEPIAALEVAQLMLAAGRCRRVILSAASNFLPVVNHDDVGTAGLFGSGAGAAVMSATRAQGIPFTLRALRWESHTDLWELGSVPVRGLERRETGLVLDLGYYTMHGERLARVGAHVVPELIFAVLDEAGWKRDDVDLLIAHQPNVRLLQMVLRRMGMPLGILPTPVSHLGNMGSASILVNLSLAKGEGRLTPGTKLLLSSFGLGFSTGAAALEL
ncbi:3-oxoacyl-[acyl-carrier-protein] synthase III C-terminal domain-containing protein [Streptomyces sp. BPTC-684]|uniref:3-oxoacyl-ACP synthase III family protein n=1 Tax=Streptomyces sp. BPTC-684 TaxID=3043734 RepID=UPI0024B23466|nr:3-oxoacyl-[acyl-carrier-protein] synthase III C-terminal domain-containing protein [Streptomyces sp. BPTC-684]WHM41082.1 3-oxoacyl-[acyl-carrier-protein] synthase III C-terminal domain-containing protein [Streptomyces sp. BPTC-684]